MGMNMKFHRPVRIGDEVTAKVTVKEVHAKERRVVMDCLCSVEGEPAMTATTEVMVRKRLRKKTD